jgi:acetyl-CoA carboxylase carboxyltransferase component
MPMARVAVMGPGAGVEFVYKDDVRRLEREHREGVESGDPEAQGKLDEGRARLTAAYEQDLMNPREALSLGSVSSIVMPGESRRVLTEHLEFLMRAYSPEPMSGPQREHE